MLDLLFPKITPRETMRNEGFNRFEEAIDEFRESLGDLWLHKKE
jgi:hypothetical protein